MPDIFNEAMLMLAENKRTLFVGQNVLYSGAATYEALEGVPEEQRIEFPVAEELQLGFCTGLSLQGFLPVCIYPRMDFMMRAMDQLVNHLDKLETMSRGQFRSKVIIRTKVGSKKPLDAGPQHTQNHTWAIIKMLTGKHTSDGWRTNNIHVREVTWNGEILTAYKEAMKSNKSTIIVENL